MSCLLITLVIGVITCASETTAAPNKNLVDSAMLPLYDMTNFFINKMVHNDDITSMEDDCDMSSPESTWKCMEEDWDQWVLYWLGFVICAGVGVVLFVVMVSVAVIVPCCRCCGNCGGSPSPIEPKNWKSQRVCCGIALFLVTCMLITASVCIFVISDRINEKLHGEDSFFTTSGKALDTVDTFLQTSTGDLEKASLVGYQDTSSEVFSILNSIPEDAIDTLDDETKLLYNFDQFAVFVEQLPALKEQLEYSEANASTLINLNNELNSNMSGVITDLKTEITKCSSEKCSNVSDALDTLRVMTNYTSMKILLGFSATAVGMIVDDGKLAKQVEAIQAEIDSTADEIDEQIRDYIDEAKEVSDDIENEIKRFIDNLSKDIDGIDLPGIGKDIADIDDDMELPAEITYWAMIGLGASLALISLCNLMGLLHDMICPRTEPKSGCCDPDKAMGANWLLAGVGFTFIFYWIYVLIVVVLFVAGGAVEAETCKHITRYNETKSHAVLSIYDGWLKKESDIDISVLKAYSGCSDNLAIYTAFQIEKQYNISEIIDLTPVEEVIEEIKKITITIDDIHIVTEDLKNWTEQLDKILDLPFEEFYIEFVKDLVNLDMEALVGDLYALGGEEGIDNATLVQLTESLNKIYTENKMETDFVQSDLQLSLETVEEMTKVSVEGIVNKMSQSETAFNSKKDEMVGKFVSSTADDVFILIKTFAADVERDIRNDVGKCEPLYAALSEMLDGVCVEALWPLNGLWFCLGWCLFFLIPSIIISFKLATLYRKTLAPKMASGFSSDNHPLYDAYRSPPPTAPPRQPHQELPTNNSDAEMYAIDNPVYSDGPEDGLQFHLPRPHMINPKAPLSSGQQQNGKHSPPPTYDSGWQAPYKYY